MSGEKRQFGAVDLVKFLCALLIVTAHYVTENATGRVHPILDYGVSIYVIVVPFFFACGGYFLFRKIFAAPEEGRAVVKGYIRRLLVMYGAWSVVYVLLQVAAWIRFGVEPETLVQTILNALTYSTYRTIWFLPAMCVGVGLTWALYRKKGMKAILTWAVVLYLLGCLGVSYRFLLDKNATLSGLLNGYEYVFQTTRNGLFNGFPLVAVGALVAYQEHRGSKAAWRKDLIFTCVFGVGFLAEALILKLVFDAVNVNTLVLLVPFTYFFLRLCLDIPMASGKWLKWMRGMSTTVFLCQRIWLSALPELFPDTFLARLLSGNPYLGLVWALTLTVITAGILQWLGKRNRIIGSMC